MFEHKFQLKRNELFEGFRILQPCGAGAFGEVYIVEDITGKRLALKILSETSSSNSQQELESLSCYRQTVPAHKNLIQILHAGKTQNGQVYYTMEPADDLQVEDGSYIPDTLENRLSWKKPMTEQEILEIISEILNGLKALHDVHVSHRDLKTGNILFIQGVPKIADVSLICSQQKDFVAGGTFDYLPPEIRKGKISGSQNQEGTDLYAVGMILYCLMTGSEAESYPIIPVNIPAQTIKILRPLYLKACNVKPNHRFSSATEFENAVRKTRQKINSTSQKLSGTFWTVLFFVLVCLIVGIVIFVLFLSTKNIEQNVNKSLPNVPPVAQVIEPKIENINEPESVTQEHLDDESLLEATSQLQEISISQDLDTFTKFERKQVLTWFFPDSYTSIENIKKELLQLLTQNPDYDGYRAVNIYLNSVYELTPQENNIRMKIDHLSKTGDGKLYNAYQRKHSTIYSIESLENEQQNIQSLIKTTLSESVPVSWILHDRESEYSIPAVLITISEYFAQLKTLHPKLSPQEQVDRICKKFKKQLELCTATYKDKKAVCQYLLQFYPDGSINDKYDELEQRLEQVRSKMKQ